MAARKTTKVTKATTKPEKAAPAKKGGRKAVKAPKAKEEASETTGKAASFMENSKALADMLNDAPKAKKAAKPERPMVNLNQWVAEGYDVWMRPCNFDHPGVDVQALCLIAPDKKSYLVMNTYDGRADRMEPTRFEFKEEKDVQKKLASLMKKEYFVYEPVTEQA